MRTTIRAACATLLPAIAVLLTLIFCSYRAGFISVSCDEFAKMMIASRGLDQPSQWFAYVWLPLHLVMIGVTSLATGDLFLASRLISIIFGIVLVVALWGIGRQLAGVWGGALAAILGATHPLVVVLSATAMVDICYVATLVLGVSFYLRFSHAQAPRPRTLFAACSLFTLSCAFHYNAWIAVLLMVPLLLRDLVVGRVSRPIMVAGLVIVGSVPCGWIGWNWIETGNPLAFFSAHSDYSANFWAHNGWHASAGAGAEALFASIRVYSPLIAILTLAAVGALFGRTQTGPRPRILWALLLGFLAALVGLYATGGRPAAFEPRYILLPSVLMISIVSAAIFRLGVAGNRQIRPFWCCCHWRPSSSTFGCGATPSRSTRNSTITLTRPKRRRSPGACPGSARNTRPGWFWRSRLGTFSSCPSFSIETTRSWPIETYVPIPCTILTIAASCWVSASRSLPSFASKVLVSSPSGHPRCGLMSSCGALSVWHRPLLTRFIGSHERRGNRS
jgi:hypothetical protein